MTSYQLYPAVAVTRRVWSVVTRNPQASVRALADELGMSYSQINKALHALRDAGYINFEHGKPRTRTIVVPCGVIRRKE